GAVPSLILKELVSALAGLFPGGAVRLEEIDVAGRAEPLFGSAPSSADSDWVEFSDGAGRLFRVGTGGSPDRAERAALSLLGTAASLALEAAGLRGLGERREPGVGESGAPELHGFVVASAEMRKLQAEIVRLAASRATVIITGESGSGKEIIARSVHES